MKFSEFINLPRAEADVIIHRIQSPKLKTLLKIEINTRELDIDEFDSFLRGEFDFWNEGQ